MNPILAMAYKELQEAKATALRDKNVKINLLAGPVFVVFFTLNTAWAGLHAWAWTLLVFLPSLPTLFAVMLATDSWSGERERRTLDTLLASPATEPQILIGKVLAHFLIVTGITLSVVLMQLITVQVLHPGFLADPQVHRALLVMTLLYLHLFLLMEAIGLFVGQRAPTTAAANAAVLPMILVPAVIVGIMGLSGTTLLGENPQTLSQRVTGLVQNTIALSYGATALLFPFIWMKNRAHHLLHGS
jgi:ABC-type transport system involved in multi-copper enzyme maturation permease subunit